MSEYSRILGDAVKQAREKVGLTQIQLGNAIGVDNRTILNIENYKGNPKFASLYPLIRYLGIDAKAIFYPESQLESPAVRQLRTLIDSCTEAEAEAITPVVQAAIDLVRNQSKTQI